MPCLIALATLMMPRLTMFIIWLFTNWFTQAYNTVIWPLLGFLFMPYTTLAYMGAMLNNGHSVSGMWLIIVIIAVITDMGLHAKARQQK